MKKFRFEIAMVAALLIYGCTAQHHIQRAEHHKQKAIFKGASLTPDIDTTYLVDTVRTVQVVNDTVYITNTITKVVTEHGEVRFITRRDKRYERKMNIKEARYNHRQAMRNATQKGKTERTDIRRSSGSRWYWWVIIILVAVFAVYLFITNRKS